MRNFLFKLVFIAGACLLNSCGSESEKSNNVTINDESRIIQESDGTISLTIDKAECYSDLKNPSDNTAEWNVFVSKSGRYDVWISSATKDTTDLNYNKSVLVNVRDNSLAKRPACDIIITDSKDVSYPYFRADSFMGMMYIQDTGEYNIQVISEKILPPGSNERSEEVNAKLISVSFRPSTR